MAISPIRSHRTVAAAAATAGTLLLAGCGASDGSAEQAEGSGAVTVVAGFYPLEWAAARVGGERVEVSSLTPPGAEAHYLELTPQYVAAVAASDLLIYLRGFQPALDEAADSEAGDRACDAGEAAELSLSEPPHDGERAEKEHAGEGHAE